MIGPKKRNNSPTSNLRTLFPPASQDPELLAGGAQVRHTTHLRSIRESKDRARRLGLSSLEAVVRLWNETMRDPGVPMQYRIRCSENLADRFGMPRESVLASMDDESPKLFEIARFEPPASMIEAHDGSGVEH